MNYILLSKKCNIYVITFIIMSSKYFCSILLLLASIALSAQVSPETLAKREKRENLTVREWNTDAKGKSKWLDHLTVYDDQGRKIEEIEYNTYGQVERVTISYNSVGQVESEVVYNDRNKAIRIRKYDYNTNGTKKTQYNYLPNGKLYSVKVFEYTFSDAK